MKKFNHIAIVLKVTLILMTFFSQNLLAEQVNTTPDNKLKFSAISIASGSFTQHKFFKVLKQPITSQGEFYFDVNLGLLWQTNKPLYSALVLKNGGVYTEDGQTPAKALKGAESLSLMLLSILSGDRAQLVENFTLTESTTSGCINLKPNMAKLAKVMKIIELCQKYSEDESVADFNQIARIILHEHSDNRTEINVKLTAISALPESIRARLN